MEYFYIYAACVPVFAFSILAALTSLYDSFQDTSKLKLLSQAIRSAVDPLDYHRSPDYVFLAWKHRVAGWQRTRWMLRSLLCVSYFLRPACHNYTRFFRLSTLFVALYCPCGVIGFLFTNEAVNSSDSITIRFVEDVLLVGAFSGSILVVFTSAASWVFSRTKSTVETRYRKYVDEYTQARDDDRGSIFSEYVMNGDERAMLNRNNNNNSNNSRLPAPSASQHVFPFWTRLEWYCSVIVMIILFGLYITAAALFYITTSNYNQTSQGYRFGYAWIASVIWHLFVYDVLWVLLQISLMKAIPIVPPQNAVFSKQLQMYQGNTMPTATTDTSFTGGLLFSPPRPLLEGDTGPLLSSPPLTHPPPRVASVYDTVQVGVPPPTSAPVSLDPFVAMEDGGRTIMGHMFSSVGRPTRQDLPLSMRDSRGAGHPEDAVSRYESVDDMYSGGAGGIPSSLGFVKVQHQRTIPLEMLEYAPRNIDPSRIPTTVQHQQRLPHQQQQIPLARMPPMSPPPFPLTQGINPPASSPMLTAAIEAEFRKRNNISLQPMAYNAAAPIKGSSPARVPLPKEIQQMDDLVSSLTLTRITTHEDGFLIEGNRRIIPRPIAVDLNLRSLKPSQEAPKPPIRIVAKGEVEDMVPYINGPAKKAPSKAMPAKGKAPPPKPSGPPLVTAENIPGMPTPATGGMPPLAPGSVGPTPPGSVPGTNSTPAGSHTADVPIPPGGGGLGPPSSKPGSHEGPGGAPTPPGGSHDGPAPPNPMEALGGVGGGKKPNPLEALGGGDAGGGKKPNPLEGMP
eukprot:PhF_6_TR31521/c0_g1_i1/m.46459